MWLGGSGRCFELMRYICTYIRNSELRLGGRKIDAPCRRNVDTAAAPPPWIASAARTHQTTASVRSDQSRRMWGNPTDHTTRPCRAARSHQMGGRQARSTRLAAPRRTRRRHPGRSANDALLLFVRKATMPTADTPGRATSQPWTARVSASKDACSSAITRARAVQ